MHYSIVIIGGGPIGLACALEAQKAGLSYVVLEKGCLVNSLYAVYERATDGFAERYLAMLAAGGTQHHSELLAPFGLDARDPAFWQGGLSVIEGMIGELEALG